MSDAYVDNLVPGNSFVADIKRGTQGSPTTICASAVFESWTPNRPGKKSNRPDIYGGPNGFLLAAEQATGSGVVQITIASTETPKIGDWFSKVLDRKSGATAEIWVFTDVSDPQVMGEYAKVNVSGQLATTPP